MVIQDKNGGTWGWESVTLDLNGHTITGSNSADATGSNAAQSGILTVYGSRVELKDSSANGGGKIVNTADTSGSSVVTVLPSDTYSANLVMGFNYESAVTLENQSTQPTANSGIYVYAPSEGELSAYVVVNDAYIKGGASAVSTSGSDNATLVISGGNYSSSVAEYVSAAKTAELVRASGDMPYSYFTDVAAAQAVAA